MAPRLPLQPRHASFRPPRLSNRRHPHGQTQTHLGSIDRLRGLRCRNRLYRCVCYWEEDATEVVLQADNEARGTQVVEYGGHEEEVGRRGNSEEGREWNVAEEQVEDAEVGEIEG